MYIHLSSGLCFRNIKSHDISCENNTVTVYCVFVCVSNSLCILSIQEYGSNVVEEVGGGGGGGGMPRFTGMLFQ